MSLFLNPCRCECEKQITKSELIVIVKRNSLQKKDSSEMLSSQNRIGAIAMEPKSMNVRRQSLFRSKNFKQIDFHELDPSLSNSIPKDINEEVLSKTFERNSTNEATVLKIKPIQKKSKYLAQEDNQDEKILKQKIINSQIVEETQRKTMKKHKKPPRQTEDGTKDLLLTTKRCKNKYNRSNSPLNSNKLDIFIQQVTSQKFPNRKGKQNLSNNIKIIHQTDQQDYNSLKTIGLMIDDISQLKKQLRNLQQDEKQLIKERDQNEKFFEQDYAIHEKKKEKLKKSCQERYKQINDIKKLLLQCKSRLI